MTGSTSSRLLLILSHLRSLSSSFLAFYSGGSGPLCLFSCPCFLSGTGGLGLWLVSLPVGYLLCLIVGNPSAVLVEEFDRVEVVQEEFSLRPIASSSLTRCCILLADTLEMLLDSGCTLTRSAFALYGRAIVASTVVVFALQAPIAFCSVGWLSWTWAVCFRLWSCVGGDIERPNSRAQAAVPLFRVVYMIFPVFDFLSFFLNVISHQFEVLFWRYIRSKEVVFGEVGNVKFWVASSVFRQPLLGSKYVS